MRKTGSASGAVDYILPLALSVSLEILNLAFVFLCRCSGFECAEVASFARSGIRLTRIQTVLPRAELANHCEVS